MKMIQPFFLDGSEKTLNSTLELHEHFSHISGFKVNFDKTKLKWIGSMKYSIRAIKTEWKLTLGGGGGGGEHNLDYLESYSTLI